MPKEETVKEQRITGFNGVNPEDRNTNGAPPKTHWWSILLAEKAEAEDRERKLKNKELMADALIEKCKQGDLPALKEFGDRVQGKAPQGVEVGGKDGGPIGITVTVKYE